MLFRISVKIIILLFITGTGIRNAGAQVDSSVITQDRHLKNIFSTTVGIQHGFIFAHSPEVENTKGSHPTGAELIFSWQKNDAAVWDLCNCFPRKGLLLAYYDYDNVILGKSFTAAYFLEPVYKLHRNMYFSFKGSAGVSYLTNPFDSARNAGNNSYSTYISAYLLVGLGVWFRMQDHWWMNVSLNYQHESNGGMKQPNRGINWPTAGIALSYQVNPRPYHTGTRSTGKYWKQNSLRWDIGVFGIARKALDESGNSIRLPLVGLSLQAGRQVGRISALTAGLEVYRDEALRNQLKRDFIEASPVKAGVMAGHEFILGRFLFSQRLGLYVFDQTPYFDRLYHRWGLHYRLNPRVGVGFNLKAHRHVANFIDLRFIWSMQKKTSSSYR
jgi:hypothetical protein